jgi:hydroxyethylthiazole kinase
MTDAVSPGAVWRTLAAIRARAPLVHNITNLVVTNSTANACLPSVHPRR